jgi:hypothetical protein
MSRLSRNWRFLTYFLELREPFTRDAWSQVSRFSNYRMLTGRPWQGLGVADGRVAIDTPQGRAFADFIIARTGIEVDHRLRPELAHFADDIATWNDRFKPPSGEENTRLGLYPYLSPSFAFVERVPGAAPVLANIHCLNFAATLSFGPSGAATGRRHSVRAATIVIMQATPGQGHPWRACSYAANMNSPSMARF